MKMSDITIFWLVLVFYIYSSSGEETLCSRDVGSIDTFPSHSSHTTVHLILNATFTCPGKVTAWTYRRSNSQAKIFASVWRQEEAPLGYFRLVGRNALTPTTLGRHTVEVQVEEQINVEPGDFIGFHYSNDVYKNSEPGALAVEYGNSTDTRMFYHTLTAGYYDENFNVDMPHTFITNDRRLVLMQPALQAHVQVNFNIVPDALIHMYACKDSSAVLDCGNRTIKVVQAIYGRHDTLYGMCGMGNSPTGCAADATLILQGACEGLKRCIFNVTETYLGDPCLQSEEFLEIQYTCTDKPKQEVLIPLLVEGAEKEAKKDHAGKDIHIFKRGSQNSLKTTTTSTMSQPNLKTATTNADLVPTTTKTIPPSTTQRAVRSTAVSTKRTKPLTSSTTQAMIVTTSATPPSTKGNKHVFPPKYPVIRRTTTRGPPVRRTPPAPRYVSRRRKVKYEPRATKSPERRSPHESALHKSAVVAGCIAGASLCILVIVLIVFYIRRHRYMRGSKNVSYLVQCRLVEGHLQSNPLYSSRPPSGNQGNHQDTMDISISSGSSPYQVTSLDKHFTYDSILPQNSSTPIKPARKDTMTTYHNGDQREMCGSSMTNAHGDVSRVCLQGQEAAGRNNEQRGLYYNTGNAANTRTADTQPNYNMAATNSPAKVHMTSLDKNEMVREAERKCIVGKKGGGRGGEGLYEESPNSDGDSSSLEDVSLMHGRCHDNQ